MFQSTPPSEGATSNVNASSVSIHAPERGGDPVSGHSLCTFQSVSIHAPERGGDEQAIIEYHATPVVSIHAPERGGDI